MYRQLGDSKEFAKIPTCGKCQLEDVKVLGQAREIKRLDGRFFFNFVGGKNLTPFSPLNELRLSEPKFLIKILTCLKKKSITSLKGGFFHNFR